MHFSPSLDVNDCFVAVSVPASADLKMRKPWDGSAGRAAGHASALRAAGKCPPSTVQEAVGEHLWPRSQLTHLFGSLKGL